MKRATAALFATAIALLPACAATASPAEAIAEAGIRTQEAESARFSMEMRMSGGPQDMTMTANGAMEFSSQQVAMTMDLGALGGQTGMGQIEMRTDGPIVYLQMPNAEQMGLPTPWLKMDLSTMTGVPGLEQLSQVNSSDPSAALDMLRGVTGDVEEVGTEEVRGASTTRYRAVVDLQQAVEDAPQESQEMLREQMTTLGLETLPIDVWIDEDGRLRRQEYTMDASNALGAGTQTPMSITTRMELFEFGTPVDVEPPPADQTTDFSQLQGGGG